MSLAIEMLRLKRQEARGKKNETQKKPINKYRLSKKKQICYKSSPVGSARLPFSAWIRM